MPDTAPAEQHLVTGCCRAPIATGADYGDPDDQGVRWAPYTCTSCGAVIGWRADQGALDLGIVRAAAEGSNDLQAFAEAFTEANT